MCSLGNFSLVVDIFILGSLPRRMDRKHVSIFAIIKELKSSKVARAYGITRNALGLFDVLVAVISSQGGDSMGRQAIHLVAKADFEHRDLHAIDANLLALFLNLIIFIVAGTVRSAMGLVDPSSYFERNGIKKKIKNKIWRYNNTHVSITVAPVMFK